MRRVFIPNRGEIARADRARLPRARAGVRGRRLGARPRRAGRAPRPTGVVCLGPGRRPRATCATTSSCRRRSAPAATRSIPATASCRRARGWPRARGSTGSTFVGPPTEAIELAGDKLAARRRRGRGAPVLPAARSRRPSRRRFAEIGYPLLSRRRAAAAAAGSSWRATRTSSTRCSASPAAKPRAAFGDERVYVERLVRARPPRRGPDRRRRARPSIHLGERDCTVQRRYQKVIEEAPAPALATGDPRGAALRPCGRAGRAIGYRNLGTVEFVLDADQRTSSTSSRSTAGSRSSTPSPRRSPGATWCACSCGSPPASRSASLRTRSARRARDRVPADRRGRDEGFMPSPAR